MAKPPKFKGSGEPDLRGHGEGSTSTQFKKGDGRHRPGRPKGSKDAKTLFQMVENMKIAVNMGGRPRQVDTTHAMLLVLRDKGLKGNLKAIEMFDRKSAQYAPPSVEPDWTAKLLDEDMEILNGAMRRGALPTYVDEGVSRGEQPRDDAADAFHEANGDSE